MAESDLEFDFSINVANFNLIYGKAEIGIEGFMKELNAKTVPKEINKIILLYLEQMNVAPITKLINDSEKKCIPKSKVIKTLTKHFVSKDIINELYSEYYTSNGMYEIIFSKRPLGFSVIMDTRGKNAIVVSIQNENNIELGMKIASRIYQVNDMIVFGWKHKEILKCLIAAPTPIHIVFKEPRKRNKKVSKDNKYEAIHNTFNGSLWISSESMVGQLNDFNKIAEIGQLFLRCSNRKGKLEDRIVKILFDETYRPTMITWGSGSIAFTEIKYISWGHWTPAFDCRNDLDAQLCFSVVGSQQILNIKAPSRDMAELWVKGLRRLIGHTDEKSNKLAKENKDLLNKFVDNNDASDSDSYSSSDDESHVRHHFKRKAEAKSRLMNR